MAAITNYHTLVGFLQHTFILPCLIIREMAWNKSFVFLELKRNAQLLGKEDTQKKKVKSFSNCEQSTSEIISYTLLLCIELRAKNYNLSPSKWSPWFSVEEVISFLWRYQFPMQKAKQAKQHCIEWWCYLSHATRWHDLLTWEWKSDSPSKTVLALRFVFCF